MDSKKLFEKYRSRLSRIGWMKAIVCSLIVGSAVLFIMGLVSWFALFPLILTIVVPICSALAAAALTAPIFYFRLFRPTTRKIARMIDGLGLEERVITMYELEQDESYIAMRQREDAKTKLNEVNEKQFRFAVSKAALIALCIVAFFGVSATTVSALAAADLFYTPGDIGEIIDPTEPDYVECNYFAYGYGIIEGNPVQLIERGDDATPVVAIADDGYFFYMWEDQVMTPERQDLNVQEDIAVHAIFMPMKEDEDGDSQNGDQSQDQPNDMPQDQEQSEGGEGQQGSDSGGAPPPEGGASGNGGSSDSNSNNDKIIDGETDYKSKMEYDAKKEGLADEADLPPEIKDAISAYLDSLKP